MRLAVIVSKKSQIISKSHHITCAQNEEHV